MKGRAFVHSNSLSIRCNLVSIGFYGSFMLRFNFWDIISSVRKLWLYSLLKCSFVAVSIFSRYCLNSCPNDVTGGCIFPIWMQTAVKAGQTFNYFIPKKRKSCPLHPISYSAPYKYTCLSHHIYYVQLQTVSEEIQYNVRLTIHTDWSRRVTTQFPHPL